MVSIYVTKNEWVGTRIISSCLDLVETCQIAAHQFSTTGGLVEESRTRVRRGPSNDGSIPGITLNAITLCEAS
jgi:hypothetical protein